MASRCSLGLPYSARPATTLSFEGKGFARHDVGEQTSAFVLCGMLDARRQVAHDQAGCCSESGPSALALALFITALPPPSRADVGQPDHDNASAAGLQLEAPLNEHESRCTTAALATGSAHPPLLLGCGHHHSST